MLVEIEYAVRWLCRWLCTVHLALVFNRATRDIFCRDKRRRAPPEEGNGPDGRAMSSYRRGRSFPSGQSRGGVEAIAGRLAWRSTCGKGATILPRIIRAATNSAQSGQLKFLIQCAGRSSRKSRQFESQLTEFGDLIEQLPAAISQDLYLAALTRCDVILLPYDPQSYPPERGSAIAIEALLTGKPMVAMDRTFAAGLIEPDSGAIGTDTKRLLRAFLP